MGDIMNDEKIILEIDFNSDSTFQIIKIDIFALIMGTLLAVIFSNIFIFFFFCIFFAVIFLMHLYSFKFWSFHQIMIKDENLIFINNTTKKTRSFACQDLIKIRPGNGNSWFFEFKTGSILVYAGGKISINETIEHMLKIKENVENITKQEVIFKRPFGF